MRKRRIVRTTTVGIVAALVGLMSLVPGLSGDALFNAAAPRVALAAPNAEDCSDVLVFFGFCGLDTQDDSAGNSTVFKFQNLSPCGDEVVTVSASGPNILFKWSTNPDASFANSVLPENLTLRFGFWSQGDNAPFFLPGYPGYHAPGINPSAGEASINANDLPGIDLKASKADAIWHWSISDQHRENHYDTGIGEQDNSTLLRLSRSCSFRLMSQSTETKSLDVPGDDKKPDGPTQAFPGAGLKYSALEPCGKTLTVSVNDPTETFRYSTNAPGGVLLELKEDGSNDWKQYSQAHIGLMPPGDNLGVKVNAYELAKAENEADWQWRIRDGFDEDSVSNVCSVKLLREIQASSGTQRTTQVQAEPKPSSNGLTVNAPEGYKVQASYSGNCASRPAGTVCLAFSDGYVWLVNDSIQSQADRGTWEGKTIRVATGAKAFYFHVLGTNFVHELKR